jgi:hypothetical protein
MKLKQSIAVFTAVFFGLLTLVALLFNVGGLSSVILGWVSFLAAIALILGVMNLLLVHLNRVFKEQNLYSGVLVLSILGVFAAAVLDGLTGSDSVNLLFNVGCRLRWKRRWLRCWPSFCCWRVCSCSSGSAPAGPFCLV